MGNLQVDSLQQAIEYGLDFAKAYESAKLFVNYKDVCLVSSDIDFNTDNVNFDLKVIKFDNKEHAIDILDSAKEYNLLLVGEYNKELFKKAFAVDCLVLSLNGDIGTTAWMSYDNSSNVLTVCEKLNDFLPQSKTTLSINRR